MQKRGMCRVNTHFECLQPVAFPQAFEGEGVRVGRGEAIEMREGGRFVFCRVAEPRPVDARFLHHRVAALRNRFTQTATFRFRRCFDTFAIGIEHPAVKRAPQTTCLQPRVAQVRTPMRTGAIQQRHLALRIAEQHEVLTQRPH